MDCRMEIESEGISYLSVEEFRDLASEEKRGDNLLILYKSKSFPDDEWTEAFKLFRALKNTSFAIQNNWEFSVVDLDTGNSEETPDSPVIRHFQNGAVVCDDLRQHINSRGVSFIQFDSDVVDEDKSELSTESSLFQLACPICSDVTDALLPWTCFKCQTLIEYHGEGKLACNCGFVRRESVSFKCKNYFHAEFTLSSILKERDTIKKLNAVKPLKKINILLIGQSGVGKSTWINAFANYLLFSSLDDAIKGEPVTLIPGQFSITDDNGILHKIVVGNDTNEELEIGASATQACRSYVLYYNGQRISFIDTPGLGDTRGYDQDMQNIRNIIEHLKTVPEIHAVCFLLLPNETRASASLLYAWKEIMCYLHCSVKANLSFVFTKARCTSYRPGETYPILEKFISEARQKTPLNEKGVIFMFDNESYRFLCAYLKSSLTFSDLDKSSFQESWDKSSNVARDFLSFASKRKPYNSQLTVDLGYVRMKMSQVIAEVVTLNLFQSVDSINAEIQRCHDEIDTLRPNNFVNVSVLKKAPCVPRLVCTGCATAAGGGSLYKTCMTPCNQSTNFNAFPNAQLRGAPVLKDVICTQCKCRWEAHMVVNYAQELVEEQRENANVTARIKEAENLIDVLKVRLQNDEDKQASDLRRKKTLMKFARLLADYLAQHSFFLTNDDIPGYIDFLIQRLETTPNKTHLQFAQMKELQNSKTRVEQYLSIVGEFKNRLYVNSAHIKYMTPESIDEAEQENNLNLPEDTYSIEINAEKRLFIK